jgi:hypothetical protein
MCLRRKDRLCTSRLRRKLLLRMLENICFPPFGVGDVVADIRIAEEVAEAYLWLMKGSNVTGSVVNSDSGSRLV